MIHNVLQYLHGLFNVAAYNPWGVLVEVGLIGVVVYVVLRFLQGTRGAPLLQGLVILMVSGVLVIQVLADRLGLERIRELSEPFVWVVVLTTLIVFQPELRRGLMRLGEARFRRIRPSEIDRIARPVAKACSQLSKNKIGALIAVERSVGLSGLTDQGIKLDARITSELLLTIFWPGSALHDLGVIIQRGRIAAAGCQFPFSDAVESVDRSIGSRHRAAIGLSLDSDAVVVVVSEETGSISIAENGRLYRHIPADALFGTLRRHLATPRSGQKRLGKDSPGQQPASDDDESPTDLPAAPGVKAPQNTAKAAR